MATIKVLEFNSCFGVSNYDRVPENLIIIRQSSFSNADTFTASLITSCKRPQTAINRLFKTLENDKRFSDSLKEKLLKSCADGLFRGTTCEYKWHVCEHYDYSGCYYIELTVNVQKDAQGNCQYEEPDDLEGQVIKHFQTILSVDQGTYVNPKMQAVFRIVKNALENRKDKYETFSFLDSMELSFLNGAQVNLGIYDDFHISQTYGLNSYSFSSKGAECVIDYLTDLTMDYYLFAINELGISADSSSNGWNWNNSNASNTEIVSDIQDPDTVTDQADPDGNVQEDVQEQDAIGDQEPSVLGNEPAAPTSDTESAEPAQAAEQSDTSGSTATVNTPTYHNADTADTNVTAATYTVVCATINRALSTEREPP